MAKSDWRGFPQKLALAAAGILFTILVSYFIWLGTAVTEVRYKVTTIEMTVKSLNDTRRREQQAGQHRNAQRIEALEEEVEDD